MGGRENVDIPHLYVTSGSANTDQRTTHNNNYPLISYQWGNLSSGCFSSLNYYSSVIGEKLAKNIVAKHIETFFHYTMENSRI